MKYQRIELQGHFALEKDSYRSIEYTEEKVANHQRIHKIHWDVTVSDTKEKWKEYKGENGR